ncbi:MAG: leucine-rich repeat domain-containing protein [Clostridia bacterium]|nr:leucine-rich repeat domain-containing protein [Clostridia bacterium]
MYECTRYGCEYAETEPHCFEDSPYCLDCGIDNETATLEFTLSEHKTSYIVSGIGTCKLKHINIPDTYRGLRVTEIGEKAFYTETPKNLYEFERITVPKGVIRIGNEAFARCENLTDIKLPESLLQIGNSAFCYTSLTNVVIPKSVTSIGELAFSGCEKLSNINIPEGVTKLTYTFSGCSALKQITLPQSLEVLFAAFVGTGLTHIDIPDSVHTIDGAFCGSQLTSIKLGNGIKVIGEASFSETKLNSITIPAVESIGRLAFADCTELREVIIESRLKRIEEEAFSNCPSLTEILIPESIEYIEYNAFDNCPNIEYNVYEGMSYLGNEEKPYLVLCGTVGGTRLIAHPDTKIFAEQALFDNEDITEVEIGENVTYIPPMALRGMDSVISATVSENNKTFYSVNSCIINRAEKSLVKAFNCSEIPSDGSVTLVDTAAFSTLGMLEVIYIPRGVKTVYTNLDSCTSLKYIIIESDVTKVICQSAALNADFSVFYCHDKDTFKNLSVTQDYDPYGFHPTDDFWYKAKKYIYSEEEPTLGGNFWHWVNGVPTPWE